MKTKTKVRAGGMSLQHNQSVSRRRSKLSTATVRRPRGGVRTNIRAGLIGKP